MNDAKRLDLPDITCSRSSLAKVISHEVMSPDVFSQVARNAELCGLKFYQLDNILAFLSRFFRCSLRVKAGLKRENITHKPLGHKLSIPLVSSHGCRLKNEICFTFIPLVSSHDRVKNEIYYTLCLFLCALHLIKFGRHDSALLAT